MNRIAEQIAKLIDYQAHHLFEELDEFPEYAARNNAAIFQLNDLEKAFRNAAIDRTLLQRFEKIVGTEPDGGTTEFEVLFELLNGVGLHHHFETADDFLQTAIAGVERRQRSFA